MATYKLQAKDSVTGDVHHWTSATRDATGYPGPNTATELAVVAIHGSAAGGGGSPPTTAEIGPIAWNTGGAPLRIEFDTDGLYVFTITIAAASYVVLPEITVTRYFAQYQCTVSRDGDVLVGGDLVELPAFSTLKDLLENTATSTASDPAISVSCVDGGTMLPAWAGDLVVVITNSTPDESEAMKASVLIEYTHRPYPNPLAA